MGELIYGDGVHYELDDRTLAHIRQAAGAKLRRNQSFYLSWVPEGADDAARVSLWLAPTIPLQLRFYGNRPPSLNDDWLRALDMTGATDAGMFVMSESDAEKYLEARRVPPHTRGGK
jgi:hypothetical protein